MDAKSEVILRQLEFQADFWQFPILLVNPPKDALVQQLAHTSHAQCASSIINIWTWNYDDYQYFQSLGFNSHFSITPESSQNKYQQIIIFIPKAKEQLDYVLEQCSHQVDIGQAIFLVGEKKAGIERAAKQLSKLGKTIKKDSARHCQLWQVTLQTPLPLQPLEHWLKHYTIPYQKEGESEIKNITIYALPGVFSQTHLDIGTKEIMAFLAKVRAGSILDFGCGAGVIGLILAIENPQSHITAVDVDAFALASTQMTFQKNQRSGQLSTLAITDIQDLAQTFDSIVSNPPFHQGIQTSYHVSENLCKFANKYLVADGELWIVANRFLNYQSILQQNFLCCEIQHDANGFKVYLARK